jgi:alkylhydroperoxidase/carboxymuconolactone decarboxylase family protein YurZ
MGASDYRFENVPSNMKGLEIMYLDHRKAWDELVNIIEDDGALTEKQKAIISLSLAVLIQSDWCITHYTMKALHLGARNSEIIDSAKVAGIIGGTPAVIYTQKVLKILAELQEIDEEEEILRAQVQLAINGEYKKLYWILVDYAKRICNEVEHICNQNEYKVKLALNIADNDSNIMARLMMQECLKHGW